MARGVAAVTLVHVQDKVKLQPHVEHRLAEFDEIDRRRSAAVSWVTSSRAA